MNHADEQKARLAVSCIGGLRPVVLTVLLAAGTSLAGDGPALRIDPDAGKGGVVSDASGRPPARAEALRVRLTVDGKAIVVRLRDNPTSRDLVAQLPLTLTLSDYAGTEKIAYLPGKLSTQSAPPGFDPSVGDVTYYAPWGNLAIFYKDFGYAKGLVPLGVVESGLTDLANLGGDVTAVVERVEKK